MANKIVDALEKLEETVVGIPMGDEATPVAIGGPTSQTQEATPAKGKTEENPHLPWYQVEANERDQKG